MASMGEFPIGNVRHTGHIEVLTRRTDGEPAILEIYTGWINVELGTGGPNLQHIDFASFLPISGTMVKQYPEGVDPSVAVIAGAETVAHDEDEAVTHGVDFATVTLEPQNLPTGAGPPRCLILRGRFGFQHLFAFNMTYHVTLLWSPHDQLPLIDLPPGVRPT
ncbi:hypothetical protein [Streptomyces sp. NPDC059874]|uniref:hypothetical protein n=1 Tax=Streptomyces sp. NPDC059874 TaxID=3346983 RepID=UPI00365854AC